MEIFVQSVKKSPVRRADCYHRILFPRILFHTRLSRTSINQRYMPFSETYFYKEII